MIIQIVGLIYIYLGKFKSDLVLIITQVELANVEQSRLIKVKAYATLEVLINITLYALFIVGNADIRFFTAILFYAVPYAFKKLFGMLLSKNSES
jgi:Flp pilus assembly protein protease CpaA